MVRFSTPVAMRQGFSRVRLQYKMGGRDLGKRLCCFIPVSKEVNGKIVTKTVDRWIYATTWKIEETWAEYKNNALDRGKSTKFENGEISNFGISGLPNEQGAGFRQQLERGHMQYYSKFNIGLVEDALYDLSAGRLDFSKRKFVVRTGERGAILFDREAKREMSGWLPIYNGGYGDVPYMKADAKTNYAPNGVSVAKPQVTKWLSSNGLEVTLMVDSSKDDTMTNKIMHPMGGPAESYRFDICYSSDESEPNIQKCTVKGQPELRGYQWGPFSNPFTGETNNSSASYDEDSAVVHYKATLGIIVKDPTRCISLIPNILQA